MQFSHGILSGSARASKNTFGYTLPRSQIATASRKDPGMPKKFPKEFFHTRMKMREKLSTFDPFRSTLKLELTEQRL